MPDVDIGDFSITQAQEGTPAPNTFLELVDPSNLTTTLWSFSDATGAANIGGVQTYFGVGGAFNSGTPDTEFGRFSPPNLPGGTTISQRDPLTVSTWRNRFAASSFDNLASGLGFLSDLLASGGVLLWQPKGSIHIRYGDFEPSVVPSCFAGDDLELFYRLGLFDSPKGIMLAVTRQPYWRGVQLDGSVNTLTNSELVLDFTAPTGTPDGWAWDSTTNITNQTIDAASEAFKFNIQVAAARNLQQSTAAATAAPGDIWTLSWYARATGGLNAKAQAVLEFMSAANAVLATATGTLTTLTSAYQRLSISSASAPASTDHIRANLRMSNSDSVLYTVYFQRAQLEKASAVSAYRTSSQVVNNDPATSGGRYMAVRVQGDAPVPVNLILTANAGSKIQHANLGIRGGSPIPGARSLTDFLNRGYFQCESGTLGTDTTLVADGTASGGNMAQVTHATAPSMTRRVKISATTLLESLRGSWDVWLRVKATAAAVHVVQLRWGPSSLDPAPYSAPEVTLDTTGMTSFEYVDLKLGTITVPASPISLSAVNFELWTRRDSGTGNLNLDVLALGAKDTSSILAIPGGSSESWLGNQLVTPTNPAGLNAGLISGTELGLDTLNEAGGTPPNTGSAWPVGFHRVRFTYRIEAQSGGSATLTYRVRNITDSTDAASATDSVLNGTVTKAVSFTSVAGKSYQAQAVLTATSLGDVEVFAITHDFYPSLGASEAFRTDAYMQAAWKQDSAGKFALAVSPQGQVPFWLQPGLYLLYMHLGDVPQPTQSLPESVLGRAVTVNAIYSPRMYQ